MRIQMRRESEDRVVVQVEPEAGAPKNIALWWAQLEDGHSSNVGAGENRGVTLRHDHVVRRYQELPAWPAASARAVVLTAPGRGEGGRRALTLVVVTDAADGAPLQALQLGC